MISKEEKQLVRFSIRNRWLSAEEGEDILFLRNKFGDKFSVVELIRRRQYLSEAELESLLDDAEKGGQRWQSRTAIFRLSALTAERSSPDPASSTASKAIARRRPKQAQAPAKSGRVKLSKSPPRRPRRKLNALSTPVLTKESKQKHAVAIQTAPEHTEPETALFEAESAVDHTIIDSSFMEQLEAVRADLAVDAPSVAPKAAVVSATDFVDPEYGAVDETSDSADRTVMGFVPDFGDAFHALPPPPVPAIEAPSQARTNEQSDAATVALQSADINAAVRAAAESSTQLLDESPLHRNDIVPTSDFVVPPSSEIDDVRKDVRRRRKTSSMRAARLDDDLLESPPSLAFEALREPSGELPPLRSRSSLQDALAAAVSDSEELNLGDQLGAYRIVRPIARGASAIVYLAQSENSAHSVAIKVLRTETRQDLEFVERFVRESEAAMQIDSENVVRIFEVAEDGGRVFSVLQYLDGWSLQERLETGAPMELVEALKIGCAISKALQATSSYGLVHRDVKPANILLGRNGDVCLTDFGLALALDEQTQAAIAGPTQIIGSPAYMSPEQALGRPIDERSDFYSLGVTLFRLLSGRDVYPGSSPYSVITKHISRDTPDLHAMDERIPEAVSRLVLKLLAKSPDQRFQTAAELTQSLEQLISRLGAVKRPLTAFGEEVLQGSALLKRSSVLGSVGLLLGLGVALGLRSVSTDAEFRSNLMLNLSLAAALSLLFAVFLFAGLGLIRRGELPLPGASTILLRLKDFGCATGVACLFVSLLVGPPSTIRVLAGLLGLASWATLVYGIVLRRSVANIRFDGGAGRTLAILGDPRMVLWSRCHGLILVTVSAVSVLKFAVLKYFQASGLN